MIGLGTRIEAVAEFNRRALIALNGVTFAQHSRTADIVTACRLRLNGGEPLTEKQQQALVNIVHRYRRQITDQLVKDYAAEKASGHDQ
jgi:hypothetical protein